VHSTTKYGACLTADLPAGTQNITVKRHMCVTHFFQARRQLHCSVREEPREIALLIDVI
jgi:hypothetical protein